MTLTLLNRVLESRMITDLPTVYNQIFNFFFVERKTKCRQGKNQFLV